MGNNFVHIINYDNEDYNDRNNLDFDEIPCYFCVNPSKSAQQKYH